MFSQKLESFGGMIPAQDDTLLPDNFAAEATNVWLYSGALNGFPAEQLLYTASSGAIKKAFRIPLDYDQANNLANSVWLEFTDRYTDVVRGALTSDLYDRYYWSSPTSGPRYNTKARIVAGNGAYVLGVPAPGSAPTVSATGGSSAVTVSRSYLYTWVTSFGEEGPPSPGATLTLKQDDVVTVGLTPPTSPDTTNRTLAKTRIYRTVTSSLGTASFFFVAEVDIGQTSFADSVSDTTVSAANQLEATTYTAPPSDLKGIVAMPNGILAGWRDKEIWFCEPYRPHAWPAQYQVSVDAPIVGLGVANQTLVICTKGSPWVCTGVNPSTMALSKLPAIEPCQSRGSIMSAPEGVYYVSPNGLVLVASGSVTNITRQLTTKDKWQAAANLESLGAARLGTSYYALEIGRSGSGRGVMIDPADNRATYVELADPQGLDSLSIDSWTGEVLTARGGVINLVKLPADVAMQPYLWKSKKFQLAVPSNLSVMKAWFEVPTGTASQNPSRNNTRGQSLGANQYGIVNIYADGQLVFTREMWKSGELMKAAPAGFKASYWQIEVLARVRLKAIELGTPARSLANA